MKYFLAFSLSFLFQNEINCTTVLRTTESFLRFFPLQDVFSIERDDTLSLALRDIVSGLPVTHITFVYDDSVGVQFIEMMIRKLHDANIMTRSYFIPENPIDEREYVIFVEEVIAKHEDSTNIIFSTPYTAERILVTVRKKNLIQRNVLYIFYWQSWPLPRKFIGHIQEAMRVAVITNPRNGTYRVYYNQATSSGTNDFKLVNWWSTNVKLFRFPVLPLASKVYHDFKRRLFLVPVIHKPPWYFVQFSNGSMTKVNGGRDDKLLALLANRLNFQYEYFDPPDRTQGSSMTNNDTFPGVLGLIWRREIDFFLGDVTVTYERSRAVEFSFLTLADSGAFVTRAPDRVNEALALIRPFHWQVWPPVLATVMLYGPILFFIIEAPTFWKPQRKNRNNSRKQLLGDCIWFSTSIFLRQTVKEVNSSHKSRLLTILLSFAATYVIGDMYSANLTSLLARPAREPPISSIHQLEAAMRTKGFQLLVESHSSSYGILQNGTGIYRRLWDLMIQQRRALIESVEAGMQLVRDHKTYVLLGGRETLYFDTRRFGAYNFHLSEKLYTRYSAIALQIGCPFVENFNHILMKLFEAGILSKMTEEEYKKLGEKLRADKAIGESDHESEVDQSDKTLSDNNNRLGEERVAEGSDPASSIDPHSNDDQKLRPISMTMLQGAFFVLLLGYLLSGISLTSEFFIKWFNKRYPNFKIPTPHVDLRPCYKLWSRVVLHCSDMITTQSPEESYTAFEYID